MNDCHQPVMQPQTGQRPTVPSFGLRNRIDRVAWRIVWALFAAWTPPALFGWRAFLLRWFGASIARGARVYSSAIIWLPANLEIGSNSSIGPRTRVYNQGRISIGRSVVISQGVHLCASSHDYDHPDFPLIVRPIRIEDSVWVAADSFIGPGVTIGQGAVLAARAVAVRDIEAWSVQGGNPARLIRMRDPR